MDMSKLVNATGTVDIFGYSVSTQSLVVAILMGVLLIGILMIDLSKKNTKGKKSKKKKNISEDSLAQDSKDIPLNEENLSIEEVDMKALEAEEKEKKSKKEQNDVESKKQPSTNAVPSKGKKKNAGNKSSSKKSKRPPRARDYRKGMEKLSPADRKKAEREKLIKEKQALQKELQELNKLRVKKSELAKSVQNTVGYVTEYEHGVLELERLPDGSSIYSIAFAFEDMNYSTLSVDEAKTKFIRYMDLINLFPTDAVTVQLILDNRTIDVDKLEKELSLKHKGDGLDEYRDEFNSIIHNNIHSGNNHLQKERYLIVSIKADNQIKAFAHFARLEGQFIQAFKRLGTSGRRLSTMERLELLHDSFRPDHVGEFNHDGRVDFKQMQKLRISMKDFICPDGFIFNANDFEMGERYGQMMFINMYPSSMNDSFFTDLTNQSFDCRATVTVQTVTMQEAIKDINKQVMDMEADKQEEQKKAIRNGYSPDMINHNVEDALDDGLTLRNIVVNENQKLFYADIAICHTANTFEELKENAKTLESVAQKHICQIRPLTNQQERGLKQSLALGHHMLDCSRSFTTENLATLMPFVSKELMHKDGFYYGMNAVSGNLIYFDRGSLKNSNGFILGCSGSGKSFSAKREMICILLATDDDLIVIDPEGEYVPFLELMGGERIEISNNSPDHINPMDLDKDYLAGDKGDPVSAKCSFIISVVETAMCPDEQSSLHPVQKAIVDGCTRKAYEPLVAHNYDPEYTPTLVDLQNIIRERKDSHHAMELAEAFELFTTGSLSAFAHKTNVNIKHRFALFDISNLDKQLNALGSLIMLDAVWNRVIQNRRRGVRTHVYADEFTVLLRRESSKIFFLDVFKRIRKYDGCATGLTQNVTSLYNDADAMEMLANAEFIYMLSQSATDREALRQTLNLSPTQLDYVTDSDKGFGIMKAGRNILPFRDCFEKGTKLYEAMTTDPDERKAIEARALVENMSDALNKTLDGLRESKVS